MSRTLIALTLAAATVAGAASAQNAVNYFGYVGDRLDSGTVLDLGTVRAANDGVVEIYDLNGNFLGSSNVAAGANSDVRVFVGHPPVSDVRAELKVDGQTVAQQIYDISR